MLLVKKISYKSFASSWEYEVLSTTIWILYRCRYYLKSIVSAQYDFYQAIFISKKFYIDVVYYKKV